MGNDQAVASCISAVLEVRKSSKWPDSAVALGIFMGEFMKSIKLPPGSSQLAYLSAHTFSKGLNHL